MRRSLYIVLGLLFGMVSICHADRSSSAGLLPEGRKNVVTKMFPKNGAMDVNIDTHLILIMEEDATIGQQGFVSVYDRKTGKLVDRLDMSIPAGPTQGQPKNPAAQYTPVPYIYKSQNVTNRNTKAGTPSGVNAWANPPTISPAWPQPSSRRFFPRARARCGRTRTA